MSKEFVALGTLFEKKIQHLEVHSVLLTQCGIRGEKVGLGKSQQGKRKNIEIQTFLRWEADCFQTSKQ
jgi:hypothetical protein